MLFLPGTQGIRLYVRVASFAISIALLVWWAFGNARHSRVHPAQIRLVVSIIYTAAMVLHPFTSSTLAGIAQIVLYVSVMAPLFWAPAVVRGPDHLARLMTLLLICNGINAFVGVMQVYDPDRWMPQEMSRLVTESAFGLGAVTYRGPNGLIVRPPGLFDNPGAVAGPGMYAALLGLVFATSASALWKRGAALLASFAGVAAIYLSQVRVSLAVLAIMLAAYTCVLMLQQRKQRAIVFGGLAGGLVVATFTFAIVLGGQSIAERTMTLFAQDPISLYSASRGGQLVYTFDDLVNTIRWAPVSARWGMIDAYFGGGSQPAAVGRDSGGGLGDRRRYPARSHQRRCAGRGAPGRAAARILGPRRQSTRVRWSRPRGEPRHRGAHLQLHALRDADRSAVLVPRRRGAGDRDRAQHGAMSTWLLVSGDFTPYGGMDMANFCARQLPRRR